MAFCGPLGLGSYGYGRLTGKGGSALPPESLTHERRGIILTGAGDERGQFEGGEKGQMVKLSVKAYGDLRRFLQAPGGRAELSLDAPPRARDVLLQLGIPLGEAWRISVNGQLVGEDHLLQDGDEMSVFSAVGGGTQPISTMKGKESPMDWGMQNRLSQLIQPDGRCFFMPLDHGYFLGPTNRLEKPGETITPLFPYCDALFVTRGVLRSCFDPANCKPIILRVSGGTSIIGKDLANEGITTSVKEAIRLNAAAVGLSIFVGSEYERESLLNLAHLVGEGEEYGIPVMAVTAVGKELEKRDARYLALSCRIAAELGARVVKTYWCEDFHKVVEGCPVPVVMAGGPKCETELEVLAFVHDGLQRGAIGVNLGRNVWQNDHPVAMARALRSVIHEKATPQEAYDLFKQTAAVATMA